MSECLLRGIMLFFVISPLFLSMVNTTEIMIHSSSIFRRIKESNENMYRSPRYIISNILPKSMGKKLKLPK